MANRLLCGAPNWRSISGKLASGRTFGCQRFHQRYSIEPGCDHCCLCRPSNLIAQFQNAGLAVSFEPGVDVSSVDGLASRLA